MRVRNLEDLAVSLNAFSREYTVTSRDQEAVATIQRQIREAIDEEYGRMDDAASALD